MSHEMALVLIEIGRSIVIIGILLYALKKVLEYLKNE